MVSYFKPMHIFFWYFIKGEKTRILHFNWYLVYLCVCFPLPNFMMENDLNFVVKLISRCNFDFNWYQFVFQLVSWAYNEKFLRLVSRGHLFIYFGIGIIDNFNWYLCAPHWPIFNWYHAWFYFLPLCWWMTKRGREFVVFIYAWLFYAYVLFCFSMF